LGTAGQLSWQSMTPSPSASVPPTPGVQIPAWHELGPPQTGVGPQEVPSGSRWQFDEQQSPGTSGPGSHCSPGSMLPSPHCVATTRVIGHSACCDALSVALKLTT